MRRPVATAGLVLGALTALAGPAWAPTMAGQELALLRAAGYTVCEPTVGPLPAELEADGTVADAIPTPYGDECALRFSARIDLTSLQWVAHHEACHLATMNEIHADPGHVVLTDPYHQHHLFLSCLNLGPLDRGGY